MRNVQGQKRCFWTAYNRDGDARNGKNQPGTRSDENQEIFGLMSMKKDKSEVRYAVCINDGGYVDDLKVRTIYKVLPDESAARSHYLRIVDETGEDYLYPEIYFVLIDVGRRY